MLNESGFPAIPAGHHHFEDDYNYAGEFAAYWTCTQYSSDNAPKHAVTYNTQTINQWDHEKPFGYSVCCVKY